ncbi:hypothetical protein Tco_1199169, partial [Tanacetum coccineum]
TFILEDLLEFGPPPRPAGDVDPDVIESIIFGPQPRPQDYVDPDFVEPIIFGPPPRPDNYREPEDLDNPMEDDTTHGGFHVESPVRPDDAPIPTADAAGRAEDPTLLTSLSAKLDRCMGRIDSLETELGTTKKIMGGAILTLVSRVKKLEKTVKQLRTTRLVGDAPAAEGDVDIQDDVDIVGLSRMASAALAHDQPAVPSEDVEERDLFFFEAFPGLCILCKKLNRDIQIRHRSLSLVSSNRRTSRFRDCCTFNPKSTSHLGVRSDDFLWDKPVDNFFSSESESDDDMDNYIPPIPYGVFKDWEIVRCPLSTTYYHVYYQENRRQKSFFYLKQLLPHVYREDLLLLRRRMNRYFRLNPDVDVGLDLWRDVNLLCQSLHSDDVEDFWRTQDEWIVSSWQLYPKSSVHVLDLTNGKTVYMFVDKFYPIRATLLERMLRHRLTVPPSYCRDIVVAGSVIQTVQVGLRESYECLTSAPM